MNYKHCCIVGADGAYKTFCPCVGAGRGWQNGRERPARHPCREQAPDRREPDCHAALCGAKGFVMPFWDSDINWTEAATDEEIAVWEDEHTAPESPESSGDLEACVTALEQSQDSAWSEQANVGVGQHWMTRSSCWIRCGVPGRRLQRLCRSRLRP